MPTAFEDYVNTELPKRLAIATAVLNNYARFTGTGKQVEARTPAQVLADIAALDQATADTLYAALVHYHSQMGVPGIPGEPGDQGDPGPPGPAGIIGATGATGSAGAVGATGPAGVSGPPGYEGEQGEPGPPIPGPTGAVGATGSTGAQGATGAAGAAGAIGPPGWDGDEGEAGLSIPGPTGPPGVAGVMGPPGQDGQDGETLILAPTSPDPLLWTSSPANDHSVSGVRVGLTAGAALVWGNFCCIGNDGKMELADADDEDGVTNNARCVAFCLETIAENAIGLFLLHGFIRDDTYNWTPGAKVYLDTTNGAATATAPSATDDCIVVLGIALSADVLYFNPQLVIVEHT